MGGFRPSAADLMLRKMKANKETINDCSTIDRELRAFEKVRAREINSEKERERE